MIQTKVGAWPARLAAFMGLARHVRRRGGCAEQGPDPRLLRLLDTHVRRNSVAAPASGAAWEIAGPHSNPIGLAAFDAVLATLAARGMEAAAPAVGPATPPTAVP